MHPVGRSVLGIDTLGGDEHATIPLGGDTEVRLIHHITVYVHIIMACPVGVSTDTYPQAIGEEMRVAGVQLIYYRYTGILTIHIDRADLLDIRVVE